MGDLAGALVITPAIVLWGTRPARWTERRELIQSCLIYAATIAIGLLAFSPLIEQSPTRSSFAFLAILPLMWAALRRNQRDTATTALLLSCFAVWGTMSNEGPFVRSNLNESFLLLLTFMISVSVPSLALSADVAVRQRHEEHRQFRHAGIIAPIEKHSFRCTEHGECRSRAKLTASTISLQASAVAYAHSPKPTIFLSWRLARRRYSRPHTSPPGAVPQCA